MEKKEDIVQELKRQLLHYNDVRTVLERVLRKVPAENIADLLISVLSDQDKTICNAAINLVEIAYSYGTVKNLEKNLIESLASADNRLKKSVLRVFACTEFGPATTIVSFLHDPDPGVRVLAAKALGEIKDPVAVSGLAVHLKETNEKIREAVKNALFSISWSMDEKCLEEYIKLLENPFKEIQTIAISCIKNIHNDQKLAMLKQALKHRNPNMRIGAAAALAQIDRYSTKEDIITTYLSESDASVKLQFEKILEGIGSTAAVTFLATQNKEQNLGIEEIFNECVLSISRIPEIPERITCLNRIAFQYIQTGKRIKAFALMDETYKLINANGKLMNKACGLIALIKTYSGVLEDDDLQNLLEEALEAAENTANRLLAAEYCTELGHLSVSFGKISKALILFNQAYRLSLQKRTDSLKQQITLWTDIARGFIMTDQEERGIELLQQCKGEVVNPSFEASYSTAVLIELIGRISLGFASAGKIGEAISLAESINEPEYDGTIHADIGSIIWKKGDKKKGASLFEKAIKIARRLYYVSSTAYAYVYLSERFFNLNNLKKTEELLGKTLPIVNYKLEKSEIPHKTILLGKIAEMYIKLGAIPKALSLIDSISDAMTKTNELLHIASIYKANDQYQELRKMLELCRNTVVCILRSREQAPLLVKIGILYNKQGDRETTVKLIQRAFQLAAFNREKDVILAELAPLLVEVVK
ncbi:MAG: HEAT repeat domain-containing protein [Spirochaetales bacterium]|nr:HEAT repeat domain-containing protein [Spirochaetales bacterium]